MAVVNWLEITGRIKNMVSVICGSLFQYEVHSVGRK